MSELSVSVIIPVLNGAETIGDTLSALASQSGAPATREIIVVDNGSTDGTCDIVRRHKVKLLSEDLRGASAARNKGLQQAGGDVIACLDSDTLPTRRWLAELVAPFRDPQVVQVAGAILSYRPETAAERYIEASGMFDPRQSVYSQTLPYACAGNTAVRRSAALAIGGWATDVPWGEDVDFSHRLLRAFPSEIAYQEKALLFHRNRVTDESLSSQAARYGRGAALMYIRFPDALPWDLEKSVRVVAKIVSRTAIAATLGLARPLRLVARERAEFAAYNAYWTRHFWHGFYSVYRRRRAA